jgi:hypothetical protein
MTPDSPTFTPTTAAVVPPGVSTIGSLLTARDRQIAAFDDRYGREAYAPSGLERRRLCLATRRRRQLLEHPSFRSFYQEVRRHVPASRVGLVASQSGFRARIVRIDDRLAVLTSGRRLARSGGDGPPVYALPPVPSHAAFVYIQLAAGDYLFVPAPALPARGTTFVDTPTSKYQRFRRTFAAIDGGAARAS